MNRRTFEVTFRLDVETDDVDGLTAAEEIASRLEGMLRPCIDCDGEGRRQDAITGAVSWCQECSGRGFTGTGKLDSEPPSDAIGRAIVEALRLEVDELHERPTLPSPGPDVHDTLPMPAQEEGAA